MNKNDGKEKKKEKIEKKRRTAPAFENTKPAAPDPG